MESGDEIRYNKATWTKLEKEEFKLWLSQEEKVNTERNNKSQLKLVSALEAGVCKKLFI